MAWTLAGRFHIDTVSLRKGWFGDVYDAYDAVLQRPVAIKAMRAIHDARREARIMAAYGSHDVLPQMYDFFVEGERAYLVMELLAGGCLGDYFTSEKRYETASAVAITVNVLRGLGHLHTRGILHRDIHPSNLIIDGGRPESLKIVDFGLAVRKQSDNVWRGSFWSDAVEYMPPEQFGDEVLLDDSSDLYTAAGVCVYLLTGAAPCLPWGRWIDPNDDPARSQTYRLICYGLHRAGLNVEVDDVDLRAVLTRALHPDRRLRYRSADEFIAALAPWC